MWGDLNMSVSCLFGMRAELLLASLYNSYWNIRPTADVSLARTHAFINEVLIGSGNSKQCGQRYLDPVVLTPHSVWEQWVLISNSDSRLSSAFKLSISGWSPLQGLTPINESRHRCRVIKITVCVSLHPRGWIGAARVSSQHGQVKSSTLTVGCCLNNLSVCVCVSDRAFSCYRPCWAMC